MLTSGRSAAACRRRANGAAISSPDRNWLETEASTSTVPPDSPGAPITQRQRLAVDRGALRAQRRQHRPERPAAQLRVGVDREAPAPGGEHRHQEAPDGARHPAVDRASAPVGGPPRPSTTQRSRAVGVRRLGDAAAERAQRRGHHLGVVGDQRLDQPRRAGGDARQQQRAVGECSWSPGPAPPSAPAAMPGATRTAGDVAVALMAARPGSRASRSSRRALGGGLAPAIHSAITPALRCPPPGRAPCRRC